MPAMRRARRLSTSIYLLAVTAGCLAGLESRLPTRPTNGSAAAVRAAVLTRDASPSAAGKARINAAYGRLPLSFEANRGQTDSQVDFLVRGAGYTMFLKPTDAVLVMRSPTLQASETGNPKGGRAGDLLHPEAHQPSAAKGSVVRMQIVGANATARSEGQDVLPGTINYFRGNDPTRWRTGISTYAKVRYTEVYPGIDLVYYGNQRQLEYDFIVAPGADPSAIALNFEGADKLEMDGEGNLIMQTAAGQLVQCAPRVYQEIDGVKRDIGGRYVLDGIRTSGPESHPRILTADDDLVRFEVGPYDRSQPLVIDPVLVYSTYLGGSSDDFGSAIAVDSAGSTYVTGRTDSSDFPTTPDGFDTTIGVSPFGDAFVTKLDASGAALVYSTYLGGAGGEVGSAIAVDSAGSAYVAGGTGSSDYPTTPGAFDTTSPGRLFVTKLDATGAALVYSTYLGGAGSDFALGIAVDSIGSAYVVGETYSSDFPTTPGAFRTTLGGNSDAFVTKLEASGAALAYSTYLGGTRFENVRGTAVDSAGSAYVTGFTDSSDFPTTPGAFDTTRGLVDAFVTKLDPSGAALAYSTYLGGAGHDDSRAIAVDSAGSAYVTGVTYSSDFPTTPGAFDTTLGGGNDVFVTKLEASGAALAYSTYVGGGKQEYGFGIAVDSAGCAYVTGEANGGFPTAGHPFDGTHDGNSDAFVTKLDRSGAALVYSTYLGGTGYDSGRAIAVDSAGDAYVTGFTQSSNFPTTPGAFDTEFDEGFNAFVAKIGFYDQPVSIEATDKTATEASVNPAAFTVNRTGPTVAALVVEYTVSGTATPDADYLALSGIVTIPAGEATALLPVNPIDDTAIETTETVIVTLTKNAAYTVSKPTRATVYIVSDELPTVSIVAADAVASEAGPTTATFTLSRNGSTSAPLTVAYTVSGTATAADDYIALKKSVTIPIGASEASIVVTPVDDTLVEAGETVALTLKASAAYLIDAASSATLTIVSDDAAASGVARYPRYQ